MGLPHRSSRVRSRAKRGSSVAAPGSPSPGSPKSGGRLWGPLLARLLIGVGIGVVLTLVASDGWSAPAFLVVALCAAVIVALLLDRWIAFSNPGAGSRRDDDAEPLAR